MNLLVLSDARVLYNLFKRLTEDKVITKKILTIITLSDFGKSIISLAEFTSSDDLEQSNYLTKILYF